MELVVQNRFHKIFSGLQIMSLSLVIQFYLLGFQMKFFFSIHTSFGFFWTNLVSHKSPSIKLTYKWKELEQKKHASNLLEMKNSKIHHFIKIKIRFIKNFDPLVCYWEFWDKESTRLSPRQFILTPCATHSSIIT